MCSNCSIQVNPQDTEAFAGTLLGILNNGATAMMLSIGHRTGLFDAMFRAGPSTSDSLAQVANLNERYVREWLGAMTVAEIVHFDPQSGLYSLPNEHAMMLAGSAPESTPIANTMQWISVLGQVESKVVDCFKNGGGVPYDAYDRFHDVMAEESDGTTLAGFDQGLFELIDGFEQHLIDGIRVLDIGCGKGHAMIELARRYPNSNFVGVDFSEEAIRDARVTASAESLTNVEFEIRDVSQLTYKAEFDLVTAFDAIHDQRDPATVLGNIREALTDEGTFLMQDIAGSSHVEKNIGRPIAPLIYTISCMHCMTVSLEQGGLGLGAAWGEELAMNMLSDAGFDSVRTHQLPHDIMNTYYIAC
ncbi:MAG: methyltransferase domain-containing protein [Phycisphaerales bacterium]|nr:methyltransferase domain-containing protein [Phycisphaerales bacterium]